VDGHRHAVTSADGTEIGLLTAGEGPPTVPAQWRARVLPMIEAGRPGRAMFSFLTEIIGLSAGEVTVPVLLILGSASRPGRTRSSVTWTPPSRTRPWPSWTARVITRWTRHLTCW